MREQNWRKSESLTAFASDHDSSLPWMMTPEDVAYTYGELVEEAN